MKLLGTITLLVSLQVAVGQAISRIDNSQISLDEIDLNLQRLQQAANVHGLSVSILRSDSILFQKAYGYRNIKLQEKLQTSHNFYAASLSKPLFAFIVMKLVDQGLINLDAPLVNYLDKPITSYQFKHDYEGFQDLKDDQRIEKITARMCLAHTTGFPNWRYIGKFGINMSNPLTINFDPGDRYSYSGEGIQLLQFVVEEITSKNLESLAKELVFEPFDMEMTSFTWQKSFDANYAVGHYKKRKVLSRKKRVDQYAAGSMDTTPEDYTRFIQAVLSARHLSEESQQEMFKPQIKIQSEQQFGPKSQKMTTENDKINLSYGLGWGVYDTPHGKAVFKEGHIAGWEHFSVLYPESDLAIVIMTNSSNGESIFKELLEVIMGDYWMPWYWENYIPYNH